jgi:hypothetical protein
MRCSVLARYAEGPIFCVLLHYMIILELLAKMFRKVSKNTSSPKEVMDLSSKCWSSLQIELRVFHKLSISLSGIHTIGIRYAE